MTHHRRAEIADLLFQERVQPAEKLAGGSRQGQRFQPMNVAILVHADSHPCGLRLIGSQAAECNSESRTGARPPPAQPQRRVARRSEFRITRKELMLIAAAAQAELRRPPPSGTIAPAAIGMARALKAKARIRFWRMVRTVARLSSRHADAAKIGVRQGHAGGADRGPRPCSHRDPHIGGDQRGCVVDPVTAHCNDLSFPLELLHDGIFLGWKRIGNDLLDLHQARDALSGFGMVAGDDGQLQASGFQLLHRLARRGPDGIVHHDDANAPPRLAHEDDSMPLLAMRHGLAQHKILKNARFLQEAEPADGHSFAIHHSANTLARDGLDILSQADLQLAADGFPDDRQS